MGTNGNCWPVNMRDTNTSPGMWQINQYNSGGYSTIFSVTTWLRGPNAEKVDSTGLRRFNTIHVTIVGNIETNTTKIYLNGVEQTTTGNESYPDQFCKKPVNLHLDLFRGGWGSVRLCWCKWYSRSKQLAIGKCC